MNEQDKRVVESMCRCGMEPDSLVAMFPKIPKEEILTVYESLKGEVRGGGEDVGISINCS